jgi:hypothetical protein
MVARKNNNLSKEGERPCKYNLTRDANKVIMVAQCMECHGGAGLHNRRCLIGILEGLSHEFNVDSVILSHYIETKYDEASMEVLRRMVELLQTMNHMGIREPYDEYFAGDEDLSSSQKNQQKNICNKCHLKPETLFLTLKKEFVNDIPGFYGMFDDLTRKLATKSDLNCQECVEATKSDIIFLFNRLEDFRAFVIHKGFKVVV